MDKYIPSNSSDTHALATSTQYRIHALKSYTSGIIPSTVGSNTVYDFGKYRFGFTRRNSSHAIDDDLSKIYENFVTLFDGNEDGIVWTYSTKNRTAYPVSASCYRYFKKLRKEKGDTKLHRQFGIPDSINLEEISKILDSPRGDRYYRPSDPGIAHARQTGANFEVNDLPSWGSLPPVICPFPMDVRLVKSSQRMQHIGEEMVCGRRCSIVRVPWGRGARTYWLHDKSHFVMRFAGSDPSFPEGGGNDKWSYSRFEDSRPIPPHIFSLPKGTKVYLPELMWDYPLPKELTRARQQGRLKTLGFALYPST